MFLLVTCWTCSRYESVFACLSTHLEVHAPGEGAALRGEGVVVAAKGVPAGVVATTAAPPPPGPPHLLVSPDDAPGGPCNTTNNDNISRRTVAADRTADTAAHSGETRRQGCIQLGGWAWARLEGS